MIFLCDFTFVRIFLKKYRVTMTTTLDTSCSENTMPGFVSKARVSACMYFLVNVNIVVPCYSVSAADLIKLIIIMIY